jgi:hypothetical protein
MQTSLFDLENRYASLSAAGYSLERLDAVIDWEIFRPIRLRIDAKARKSAAGRKTHLPHPHVQAADLATFAQPG